MMTRPLSSTRRQPRPHARTSEVYDPRDPATGAAFTFPDVQDLEQHVTDHIQPKKQRLHELCKERGNAGAVASAAPEIGGGVGLPGEVLPNRSSLARADLRTTREIYPAPGTPHQRSLSFPHRLLPRTRSRLRSITWPPTTEHTLADGRRRRPDEGERHDPM